MKKNLKKAIAAGMVCTLIISAAAGCGVKKSGGGDGEQVVLKVGNWPSAELQKEAYELWEGYLAEMTAKYPNIKVEKDPFNYDYDTFLPSAASGQVPNVFQVPFTEPKKLVNTGYVADLSEQFEKYGYKDAFNDSVLDIISSEGKYYGVPYESSIIGMFYNRNLFKEAGLVNEDGSLIYPKTTDELVQTAVKIKEKTGKAGFAFPTVDRQGGWAIMSFAWSQGVEFMKQDSDGKWKATFDSPEMVGVMQFISDLKWKYNVLPENILLQRTDADQLFGTNQLAMMYGAEFMLKEIFPKFVLKSDEISTSPVPKGTHGAVSQVGGSIYMCSKDSTPEQLDAAFKWFDVRGVGPEMNEKTMENKSNEYKVNSETGYIVPPISYSIYKSPERLKKENEVISNYINVKPEIWNTMYDDSVKIQPEEPVEAQQLYSVLSSLMQRVLSDKNVNIEEIVKEANANFQSDFLDKLK